MSWFLVILFLSLAFNSPSEARHEKKLPSAVVVGTVYCDTCFQDDFSKTSHFISGATVAVECKDGSSRPSFRKEVKTDEHGEFKVHLPFSVSKHVKKIKGCSVTLITSSEPYCAVASTATSSSLHLKSRKQGTHIFSAGFFTFKPLKQPTLCNQKPSIQNSKELSAEKDSLPPIDGLGFPPPIQDPTLPDLPPANHYSLPPLPRLPTLPPLPQLPPLPPLPGLPFPPIPGKTTNSKPAQTLKTTQLQDKKVAHPDILFPPVLPPNPFEPPPLIPNPFQPPPLIPNPFQPPPLIPNPFQPPPLIPNPFQPPAAPLFPFPQIPGLTPPPPPPSLPFPFPPIPGLTPPQPPPSLPLPLPPIFPSPPPRIPVIPPASTSKQTSP